MGNNIIYELPVTLPKDYTVDVIKLGDTIAEKSKEAIKDIRIKDIRCVPVTNKNKTILELTIIGIDAIEGKVITEALDIKVGDEVTFRANGRGPKGGWIKNKLTHSKVLDINTKEDGTVWSYRCSDPDHEKAFDAVYPEEILSVNGKEVKTEEEYNKLQKNKAPTMRDRLKEAKVNKSLNIKRLDTDPQGELTDYLWALYDSVDDSTEEGYNTFKTGLDKVVNTVKDVLGNTLYVHEEVEDDFTYYSYNGADKISIDVEYYEEIGPFMFYIPKELNESKGVKTEKMGKDADKKYSNLYKYKGKAFSYNKDDAIVEYVWVDPDTDEWVVIDEIGLSNENWEDRKLRDAYLDEYIRQLDDEANRLADDFLANEFLGESLNQKINRKLQESREKFDRDELVAVKDSIDTALDDLQIQSDGTTGAMADKVLVNDLRNVSQSVGSYLNRVHESKSIKTEATSGTIKESLNTGVLPIVDVDLYGLYSSGWFDNLVLDDNSNAKFDEIIQDTAPRFIKETLQDILPSVEIYATGVYHPREYNFSGDELEFDLVVNADEYNALKGKALSSDVFETYLKDKYSSRSGFISSMPDDIDEFNNADEWKQMVQVIMFALKDTALTDVNEAYLNDFSDAVNQEFPNVDGEIENAIDELNNKASDEGVTLDIDYVTKYIKEQFGDTDSYDYILDEVLKGLNLTEGAKVDEAKKEELFNTDVNVNVDAGDIASGNNLDLGGIGEIAGALGGLMASEEIKDSKSKLEEDNYTKGKEYLERIAKSNGEKYYEIVEDTYEYPNGLMLITYNDEAHEDEKDHICIDLDNLQDLAEANDRFADMVRELHSYVEADPTKISKDLKQAISTDTLDTYLKTKAAMTDEEVKEFKAKYLSIDERFLGPSDETIADSKAKGLYSESAELSYGDLEDLAKDIYDWYDVDMGTHFDEIQNNEETVYGDIMTVLETKDQEQIQHFIDDITEADIDDATAKEVNIATTSSLIDRLKALLQ